MEDYTDLSQSRESGVWQHFLFNKTDENAKFKKNFAIIKGSGPNTKSLMAHLKSKYNVHVTSSIETTTS